MVGNVSAETGGANIETHRRGRRLTGSEAFQHRSDLLILGGQRQRLAAGRFRFFGGSGLFEGEGELEQDPRLIGQG